MFANKKYNETKKKMFSSDLERKRFFAIKKAYKKKKDSVIKIKLTNDKNK